MTQRKTLDLGTDSINKLLWHFSVPAIVGLLINASYGVVDRIFIGNGVGPLGLASVAICFPTVTFQLALGLMIGIGGSVNFAVSLGERKIPRAEHIFANAVASIIVIALIFTALHLFFLEDLLRLFGATDSIMPYAKTYLSITLLGSVCLMGNMTLNNFIRASGSPRYAMGTMIVGAVTNTVLDYIFIFIFNWGIAGAAYATLIAQTTSFMWASSFFISSKAPYRIKFKRNFFSFKVIGLICSVGVAPFLIQSTSGLMQSILNTALAQYGQDIAVSAMGVTLGVTILLFMPVIGLCEGAQPVIGFNYGAKNYGRLCQIFKRTLFYSIVFFTISCVVLQIYAAQIVAIFNNESAELITIGTMSIKTISLLYPIIGLPIATSFFLQATKNAKTSAFLALSRQILFLIPCLIILPKFFGLKGVFYSFPTSDSISFFVALPICLYQFKKYKRLEKEKALA